MKILVAELVGANAMTVRDGQAVFEQIHRALQIGEAVELDFAGVKVFASPFFNSAVGRLLADLSAEQLNLRLAFTNLSEFGERVLRRVIENAKDYYGAPQERRARIDEIVHENAMPA